MKDMEEREELNVAVEADRSVVTVLGINPICDYGGLRIDARGHVKIALRCARCPRYADLIRGGDSLCRECADAGSGEGV